MASKTKRAPAGRAVFPPEQVAEVKAVACSPPAGGAPLSRRSTADVHRLVIERGICEASHSTIVRWLAEDAIRPWLYRSWIFPTDPDFAAKAGPILDLYEGRWEGRLFGWKFTREDLNEWLERLAEREAQQLALAA